MFNMENIGLKISELRKSKDMTQMELADKMNISFQAVSNWERGNSMPDISKLPELAEIFGVSVDDIIGKKSALLDSIVNGNIKEHISDNGLTNEEIKEIAPILRPSQAENIFESAKDTVDIKEIRDLFPFLDQKTIDDAARKLIAEDKSILDIVVFVSDDIVDEYAVTAYDAKGMCAIRDIVPFVSDDILKQIAEKEYAQNGLQNFVAVAPFLDESYLNQCAKKAIEKDGIKAICPIAPFLDQQMLSEFVREKFL